MSPRRPASIALFVVAGWTSLASAQAVPDAPKSDTPPPAPSAEQSRIIDPYMPKPSRRTPTYSRTTAHPDSRSSYSRLDNSDDDYGFRNPGGVGRRAEFYPPGNKFQNGDTDPVRAATFNGGSGVSTVQDQMQAQQLGVNKARELHQHMDNYSRPFGGMGFGFGYGLGYGARFPY